MPLYVIEYPPNKARMNNRETKEKATKNQFKQLVEERIESSRVPKVKKVDSPEKIARKEASRELFEAKKVLKKALKNKGKH